MTKESVTADPRGPSQQVATHDTTHSQNILTYNTSCRDVTCFPPTRRRGRRRGSGTMSRLRRPWCVETTTGATWRRCWRAGTVSRAGLGPRSSGSASNGACSVLTSSGTSTGIAAAPSSTSRRCPSKRKKVGYPGGSDHLCQVPFYPGATPSAAARGASSIPASSSSEPLPRLQPQIRNDLVANMITPHQFDSQPLTIECVENVACRAEVRVVVKS